MKKRRFVVFDIDGTLIRWQLYHSVVSKLATSDKLTPNAAQIIIDSRRAWENREKEDAFDAYEMKLVDIFNTAVAGLQVDDFMQAIDEVYDEYRDRTYRYTRELIKSLKAEGYVVLAISGSPHDIVKRLGDHYGFDDVRGDKRIAKDGVFTGERVATIGAKAMILEEFIRLHDLTKEGSIGVGDSEGDIQMLSAVETPIAFNPSKGLFEHAKAAGWKVVIERKNMIYELEYDSGHYRQTN